MTENYTYDALYQLTRVAQGATTTESYSYDAVGNRLSSLGMSPYVYNSSNELTSTPAATYAYDPNGSTLSKTTAAGLTQYTWDFENRLSSVMLPGAGGTVTFKYDPVGRRIQKSSPIGVTTYLYDGANSVQEVDSAGAVLARYAQGAGIDEPLAQLRSGTAGFYEQDGLGSVTSLSNSAATLANSYAYDAFGNLTASTGSLTNPFQYTGRDYDSETGLRYYRARYYESTIGRFISEDQLRLQAGVNFYIYVANNPLLYIDPTGLIHYNKPPPDTVPVSGKTAVALQCLEHCLQCLTHQPKLDLLVTGGAEKTGHSKHSFHYKGEAVDISYYNQVTTTDVFRCAEGCGILAGGAEPKKHHWHLQMTPGNGSQPLPLVLAPPPKGCCP